MSKTKAGAGVVCLIPRTGGVKSASAGTLNILFIPMILTETEVDEDGILKFDVTAPVPLMISVVMQSVFCRRDFGYLLRNKGREILIFCPYNAKGLTEEDDSVNLSNSIYVQERVDDRKVA